MTCKYPIKEVIVKTELHTFTFRYELGFKSKEHLMEHFNRIINAFGYFSEYDKEEEE